MKSEYEKHLNEVSQAYYRINQIKSKMAFTQDYNSYLRNECHKQKKVICAHRFDSFLDFQGEFEEDTSGLKKEKFKDEGIRKF